jgi:hypothetical protein
VNGDTGGNADGALAGVDWVQANEVQEKEAHEQEAQCAADGANLAALIATERQLAPSRVYARRPSLRGLSFRVETQCNTSEPMRHRFVDNRAASTVGCPNLACGVRTKKFVSN